MVAKAGAKNPYSVHPGVEMTRKWAEALEGRTGRTLEQWVEHARRKGPKDEKERRAWLKEEGLDGRTAWWLAQKAGEEGPAWDDDPATYLRRAPALVDAQFSGRKAALRPVYDALLARGLSLGPDVRVCPCGTMVPFYRKFVFAEIHASTADRVDLGLALGDVEPGGRLEKVPQAAGNRVGHRISLSSPAEVDAEVDRWLREAYAKGNAAIERSREPRKTPPDLARGLAKSAKARATFESLTPRMRAEFVSWILEAKKEDTRARRVAKALERLGAGKKTLY